MSDAISALQISWDAPYRLLASVLSIGCLFAFFGWFGASSPFDAVGHIGTYLGIPQAAEISGGISLWMSDRKEFLLIVAGTLLAVGLVLNVGTESTSTTQSIPGPWRGAPTALIALAVLWEVDPQGTPVGVGVAFLIAFLVARFSRSGVEIGSWLASTFANVLGSVLFVLAPVVWMLSRSTPKPAAT